MIDQIKQILLHKGETLAVAESLTSGHLQALIGSISGASAFFVGGITAYTLEQKVQHLSVNYDEAVACNCVSELIAQQMALGVCEMFGSDWGISTTGYAEAWGDIQTPHAYYAIAYQGTIIQSGKVDGNDTMSRVQIQHLIAKEILSRFAVLMDEY